MPETETNRCIACRTKESPTKDFRDSFLVGFFLGHARSSEQRLLAISRLCPVHTTLWRIFLSTNPSDSDG